MPQPHSYKIENHPDHAAHVSKVGGTIHHSESYHTTAGAEPKMKKEMPTNVSKPKKY